MSKQKFFRQGDVAVIGIAKRKDADYNPCGKIVMAQGEVTGHAHAVLPLTAVDTIAFDEINEWRTDPDSRLRYFCRGFLRVKGNASAVHEDHVPPIPIKSGEYEIRIQSEYSPADFRKVQD